MSIIFMKMPSEVGKKIGKKCNYNCKNNNDLVIFNNGTSYFLHFYYSG